MGIVCIFMDARLEWGGFLGFWLVFFGLGGSIFGFGWLVNKGYGCLWFSPNGWNCFLVEIIMLVDGLCVFLVFIFGLGNYFSNAGVLNMVSLSVGQLCIFKTPALEK